MKSLRVLLSIFVVVAALLAISIPSHAINFVAEDIYESVFVVYSGNSLGSGFSIGKECVITNAHVINNEKNVVIKDYSGNQYEAVVLGIDREKDIAVLGVREADFPCLSVADESSIKTGDDIYAIGAPKSMSYTLTKGVISAKSRTIGKNSYIQIDAPINEGNSGGPLLNDKGEVLGVNTLKMTDSEGIGLAIPIQEVIQYLQSLNLEVNEEGNVTGDLQLPEGQENQPEGNKKTPSGTKKDVEETDSSTLWIFLFILSMIGNAVFLILFITERTKNSKMQRDMSERTDFEIEILE